MGGGEGGPRSSHSVPVSRPWRPPLDKLPFDVGVDFCATVESPGKNYLFDRRFEQRPEMKAEQELQKDIESYCATCKCKWDRYRGQFKCAGKLPEPHGMCNVPILVCDACQRHLPVSREELLCPLCEEGYQVCSLCVTSTHFGSRSRSRHHPRLFRLPHLCLTPLL